MEIGISDRNAHMCDGAKDKGKTAIDDCDDCDDCEIPVKGEYVPYPGHIELSANSDCDRYCISYSEIHSKSYGESESESDSLHLDCSDGVQIDAQPFRSESRLVLRRYIQYDYGIIKVDSNSRTLEMVKEYCERRLKILLDYDAKKSDKLLPDSNELYEPLNEFSSKFFQDYRSYAIQLITAAFELEIITLIFLMMEEVVNLFTTKMTEDEVYKFFVVNLKEYREDKFNVMEHDLLVYRDILVRGDTPNDDWDSNLLKRKFHSLQSYKEQRQWLTAHFILRCPSFAGLYLNYFKESAPADEEDEKR